MKHIDIISIHNFSLSKNFSRVLKNLRFRNNSLIRVIEKQLNGEWPLLIRPVNKDFTESDLNIAGTDIRKPENWEIKEISSDAA
jgi:dihydropteroate synthase